MNVLFALVLIATGAFAGESSFAGISLANLPALGLGEPVFVDGADQWKATVSDGYMIEIIEPDATAARSRYSFQSATIGAKLPYLKLENADDAAGDAGLVIARRGNVVLLVRSSDAVATATRLLAAVQTMVAAQTIVAVPAGELAPVAGDRVVAPTVIPGVEGGPFTPAVEARDAFGRRVPSPRTGY